MSAAPVSAALPNSPPRPVEIALLASVFIIAACGLLYELAAGAIASYVLGDSVLQFSTIIGAAVRAGVPGRDAGGAGDSAGHAHPQAQRGA
jgi:hypothetical protein